MREEGGITPVARVCKSLEPRLLPLLSHDNPMVDTYHVTKSWLWAYDDGFRLVSQLPRQYEVHPTNDVFLTKTT